MAIGVVNVFDLALLKIDKGLIDLDGASFKLALCDNSQALTTAFAGTSTDARFADLTGEFAAGGGYTAGGEAISGVTVTQAAGVVTFDASDVTWATLTKTGIKYAVGYADSNANKDLLFFVDLDTGGGPGVDNAGPSLTIQWNASGLFTKEQTN